MLIYTFCFQNIPEYLYKRVCTL